MHRGEVSYRINRSNLLIYAGTGSRPNDYSTLPKAETEKTAGALFNYMRDNSLGSKADRTNRVMQIRLITEEVRVCARSPSFADHTLSTTQGEDDADGFESRSVTVAYKSRLPSAIPRPSLAPSKAPSSARDIAFERYPDMKTFRIKITRADPGCLDHLEKFDYLEAVPDEIEIAVDWRKGQQAASEAFHAGERGDAREAASKLWDVETTGWLGEGSTKIGVYVCKFNRTTSCTLLNQFQARMHDSEYAVTFWKSQESAETQLHYLRKEYELMLFASDLAQEFSRFVAHREHELDKPIQQIANSCARLIVALFRSEALTIPH